MKDKLKSIVDDALAQVLAANKLEELNNIR